MSISLCTGDLISITIEAAISGHAMGSLVVQPGGCGEQNMIGLTMPVIATHYLDKTNQWHTVKAGLRQTAVFYITKGKLNIRLECKLLCSETFVSHSCIESGHLIVLMYRL